MSSRRTSDRTPRHDGKSGLTLSLRSSSPSHSPPLRRRAKFTRRMRYALCTCVIFLALVTLYRRYPHTADSISEPSQTTVPKQSDDQLARPYPLPIHPPTPPAESPAPVGPIDSLRQQQVLSHDDAFGAVTNETHPRLANATFVMLARNSDLEGALLSVRALEDRFKTRHHYPWVFLNDEEFSENFKQRIRVLTPSTVEFGVIPREHWAQPDWIDEQKQQDLMSKMEKKNVKYGGNLAYHNMCRFNSGFFFKHPLLLKYKWYWRVEPKVKFHCDILEDPFLHLEDNDKVYGFTLSVYEIPATITSLWSTVREFMELNPTYIRSEDNALAFISNDNGRSYNRCHFWSNFEIASMDFWRGEAYSAFFEHLDATGGFYYERWGDAPVHSIAAALFLRKDQIHLFEDIGYQHDDWSHCPRAKETWERGRCMCTSADAFDYTSDSCRRKWDALGVS